MNHFLNVNPNKKEMQINPQIHLFRIYSTLSFMLLSLYFPTFFENYASIPIILSSIVLLIIPHGALDHIVFYQMYSSRYTSTYKESKDLFLQKRFPLITQNWIPKLVFYFHYLFIMLLWYIAWQCLPSFTLLSFLLLSAYHFGEGDLDYIQLHASHQAVLYLSRGFYILSLLIFQNPTSTWPILSNMIHLPTHLTWHSRYILGICTFQHILLLLYYALRYSNMKSDTRKDLFPFIQDSPFHLWIWMKETIKCFFLWCLFQSMNPLVAFILYLGIWHSIGHSLSEIAYLKHEKNSLFISMNMNGSTDFVSWNDLLLFFTHCLPFTMISFLSMIVAYGLSCEWNSNSYISAWTLFVMSISILTGPHLWIVAAMHSVEIQLDPFELRNRSLYLINLFIK